MNTPEEQDLDHLGSLSKKERRVLGVLIEKSLTTPEQYPLTLKSLTTGCNQKSNRAPLANYDEFEVEDILEQLRERGLVTVVQTAGGRTERFRHLVRDKTGWNPVQLAVMGELLLRGRQQLGELRSRASRMAAIESLDVLRHELHSLMQLRYVQASGELQRRGIEVDHALYTEKEQDRVDMSHMSSTLAEPNVSKSNFTGETETRSESRTPEASHDVSEQILQLEAELSALQQKVEQLEDRLSDLERTAGI